MISNCSLKQTFRNGSSKLFLIQGSFLAVGSPLSKGVHLSQLSFRSNQNISIGVEVEIQLIDPLSGDLKPVAPLVLRTLQNEEGSPRIKSELFQSMLEIDTPICNSAIEAGKSLRSSLALVKRTAQEHGAQVMMSGTHPFADYSKRLLTHDSRYHMLVDRNQWIARRLQIFGLHIHLGMRDGNHAIAMNNALCHYLPMILAFSASSPYWNGTDTGLASSRITFFEAMPTGGHPYLFDSWDQFEKLIHKLKSSHSIQSMKDLWWDIRPNTEYGTIEVRIADCPPTLREVEAIVAFLHALTVHIDSELFKERLFSPPPEWILRENKWRVSRHGVQAELVKNAEGEITSILSIWHNLRNTLSKQIVQFDYHENFDFLFSVIQNGPSYQRQRKHAGADLKKVVKHLIKENENDFPSWKQ